MKTITDTLFSILRNALFDEVLAEETKVQASDNAEILFKISKKHDLAHLAAYAFEKNGIEIQDETLKNKFKRSHFVSVIRYERIVYDFNKIVEVLEEEKIDFVPLKGSVIRELYPEPWMRSSCDIDILVKEEDLDRAVNVLCEKASFSCDNKRDFHDVSLFSEGGTHLELHFNIMENMKQMDNVLSKVWQYAKPSAEGSSMYKLQTEFLIFHILAHMSYHVINGGSGIRSFVDLYLLEKKAEYDDEVLREICNEGGLSAFKTKSEQLSSVWMENKEHNDETKMYENFILGGGVYGSLEAASAIKHVTMGSKGKYIMSRVFQPYNILKEKYPVLRKHKWLTPAFQVRRWFSIMTSDKKKLAPEIFKAGSSVSKEKTAQNLAFLKSVGLDDK